MQGSSLANQKCCRARGWEERRWWFLAKTVEAGRLQATMNHEVEHLQVVESRVHSRHSGNGCGRLDTMLHHQYGSQAVHSRCSTPSEHQAGPESERGGLRLTQCLGSASIGSSLLYCIVCASSCGVASLYKLQVCSLVLLRDMQCPSIFSSIVSIHQAFPELPSCPDICSAVSSMACTPFIFIHTSRPYPKRSGSGTH